MTKSQIIQEAMRLSDDDRREVADVLASSFDAPHELDLSPELRAELDRRWEAHLRNPEAGSTWDEVKARLGYAS